MESDYDDYEYVIVNGQTIPGSQMASKVFIIICDVEPGFDLYDPGKWVVTA
jgi:hypothetical protein